MVSHIVGIYRYQRLNLQTDIRYHWLHLTDQFMNCARILIS